MKKTVYQTFEDDLNDEELWTNLRIDYHMPETELVTRKQRLAFCRYLLSYNKKEEDDRKQK